MCGTSGRPSPPKSRAELQQEINESQRNSREVGYLSGIADGISDSLKEYNDRDTAGTNTRINQLLEHLGDLFDGTIDMRFGGSISRHTYVDGLSDIDALVFVNRADAEITSPEELIADFAAQLREKLGAEVEVEEGQMAVTVTYPEIPPIQLLPAVKTATGVRISDAQSGEWSKVVHPDRFAQQLTETNQRLRGRLVPSIKILKPLLNDLGMSGYHIDALAIRAVQNVSGQQSEKGLVERILKYSAENVNHRLTDSTGQEQYVDSYLGEPNSTDRSTLSAKISSTLARLEAANQSQNPSKWLEVLE